MLFSSIVDDPSSRPDLFPTTEAQDAERERLFSLVRRMVKWGNASDEHLLAEVRAEIMRATNGDPPAVADQFCGGGSIPLEAQRLGLTAYASDLNPVAVLITKALIEIPPLFANKPSVRPQETSMATPGAWKGAAGLAEDVRYYGEWVRERALERIGHLYPRVTLLDGSEATVVAWLWMRTITCPNPACGYSMPLTSKFDLSQKKGNERHAEPVIDHDARHVRFEVAAGPSPREGTVGRNGAVCLVCSQPVDIKYIRGEARAGRMAAQMFAIVAEGVRGRVYLPAEEGHEKAAESAEPRWAPEGEMPDNPRWFSPPGFGMTTWASLFSPRQLTALTTFCDLTAEARDQIRADAIAAGLPDEGAPIRRKGSGAEAYAQAVGVYLALAASKSSAFHNTLARWRPGEGKSAPAFGRQAIPMVWDYAEVNPFAGAGGDWSGIIDGIVRVLRALPARSVGITGQADSTSAVNLPSNSLISTDPPYYDNIGYADLADFF